MSNHQYTDFQLFSKLPQELRRMIWDYAVEEPHVAHARGFFDRAALEWVKRRDDADGGGDTNTPTPTPAYPSTVVSPRFPPVHDACREARRIFLKSPGLALPASRGIRRATSSCTTASAIKRGRRGWQRRWAPPKQHGTEKITPTACGKPWS